MITPTVLNVLDIDAEMRRILSTVTKETSVESALRITNLGFSPRTAWKLVEDTLRTV